MTSLHDWILVGSTFDKNMSETLLATMCVKASEGGKVGKLRSKDMGGLFIIL